MTDPIIVPISAPGATEASAQVRTFAKSVGEQGAAAEVAAKAQATHAKATEASGNAAQVAAAKNAPHLRSLEQEIARLKALEHQAEITRQARSRLGESANAADVSAIRRFGRSLGGGIAGEAARGVSEGYEGAGGSGLRSSLGVAGAGLAGAFIAFEGFKTLLEHINETIKEEAEERVRLIGIMQDQSKTVAGQATGAEGKYGAALRKLAGAGPDDYQVHRALGLAKAWGDSSVVEGYADAQERFSRDGLVDSATLTARRASRLGGGSFADVMKKLNPEMVSRAQAGGGTDALVGELLGGEGRQLSAADVADREKYLNGSAWSSKLDFNDAQRTAADLADINKIGGPEQRGALMADKADHLNPGAATAAGLNRKDFANQEAANLDSQYHSGVSSVLGIQGGPLLQGAFDYFGRYWNDYGGKKSAADKRYDTANALMPGAEEAATALEDAAAALRGIGRGGSAPAGATP